LKQIPLLLLDLSSRLKMDEMVGYVLSSRLDVGTTSHQELVDVLSQLEDDQSLYEAQVSYYDSVSSMYHLEIIAAGRKMAEKVRLFADHGYTSDLQPAFMVLVVNAMKDYMNIMSPKKIKWCPCLKPARRGFLYEALFFVILTTTLSIAFECEAVVIEFCGQRSLLESFHFVDYIHRMTSIQNDIKEISERNNEQSRESVRIELLRVIENVGRYLQLFSSDTSVLMSLSHSKLESLAELLAAPADCYIAKHLLIKAISSLQQIMNAVSEISLKKSNDNIATLDSLSGELGRAWNSQIASLTAIESQIYVLPVRENLTYTIRGNEDRHNNSNLTLIEAKRRWTETKYQSVPRPVLTTSGLDDNSDLLETTDIPRNIKKINNTIISPFTVERTMYSSSVKKKDFGDRTDNTYTYQEEKSNNSDMIEFHPTISDKKIGVIDGGNCKYGASTDDVEMGEEEDKLNNYGLKNDGNIMLNNRSNTDKKGNNYHILEDNS
jgi:hypothetical protein